MFVYGAQMLTVITFKWSQPGYRSKYDAAHVNTMQRMVARHYPHPHRFVCITDDPAGVDCETWPLWSDYSEVPNPTWPDRGPSCYRRLKLFEYASCYPWVWLDLDAVITGDLAPLWHRPEPIVTYTPPGLSGGINGAMLLCNEPERFRFVWDLFDPDVSPKETTRLGYRGSDQAWLTACLQHCSGKWGEADGCYDYSGLRKPGMGMRASGSARRRVALPTDARIVFFHGKPDPWEVSDQWVLDNYK